jgi:hypothetical protein
MADLKIGKGVYVWQPGTIERGDPEAIAARLKLAGVQTVAIKICDGFKILGGLEPLMQTLRTHGIQVGAWGYSYLNRAPLQEAHVIADACHRYAPDFYLMDVETEVEGNFGGARMFLNELRPAIAGLPLGLNSFWNVRLHPQFPWLDFMKAVDFVCPQVYGHGADPVEKLIESQQTYGEVPNAPEVPMPVVAGDMHIFRGMRPTPDHVMQFLAAADSDPFINGVIMWAADDTQTTPDLWQAFSNYQWKNGGRTVPPQPLGWAKVRAGGGMWIRSSPVGAKVGGLARAELAPIWAVTETKWGAITQSADQWIFLGNPVNVETTLDLAAEAAPPSAGTELFQARVVPSRGLNVRDAIAGRVLRALRVNTMVRVYEARDGWARINPAQNEWVSAAFLSRIMV